MITLYGFGPGLGLPEISPYVTKAEAQLQMAGLAYRKERAMPDASPKGQLPFIADGGEKIADSHFIRAYLEERCDIDLDAGLDARARAESWAIERMLENHFGWISSYYRWMVPENFARGPARFFDGVPEHLREGVRADALRRVGERIHSVGISRHAPAEIAALGARSLQALSALLGDQPYLFGGKPTAVDATAFAMVAAISTPFFDSPLQVEAARLPNLVDYTARMMRRHYPDFAWPQPETLPTALRQREIA